MIHERSFRRAALGTAMAALIAASLGAALPAAPAVAQSVPVSPTDDVMLSVGSGRMVRMKSPISDIFVANDNIADVQVRSANQIFVFGKGAGETSVFATNSVGKVVYSANVRVGNNIASVGEMLDITMPEADITATPMNGLVLLTGTVGTPADAAEAERLVQAFVGEGSQVISRIKTATPLQVMLQVKIAEVSRSLIKNIGINIDSQDRSGGSTGFVIGRGREFGEFNDSGGFSFEGVTAGLRLSNVLGVDIAAAIDANENSGLVTLLAEPTLTALSGETASFLAGGEFPIATTSGLNGTSIQFKEYGVSLAFTPTVLERGRISMRVRPEVSELTTEGAIRIGGVEIPAISTRRAETTVELGSGQSFMIGGLMRNNASNSVEKTPWLGDIPILGALFRSTGFRRNESELVIIVTPYLVKPVNANQIALPTDGFRIANDAQRVLIDQRDASVSGEQRPVPRLAAPQTVTPGMGAVSSADVPPPAAPPPVQQAQRAAIVPQNSASATPGFSF